MSGINKKEDKSDHLNSSGERRPLKHTEWEEDSPQQQRSQFTASIEGMHNADKPQVFPWENLAEVHK